jgi:hypothetical protein
MHYVPTHPSPHLRFVTASIRQVVAQLEPVEDGFQSAPVDRKISSGKKRLSVKIIFTFRFLN